MIRLAKNALCEEAGRLEASVIVVGNKRVQAQQGRYLTQLLLDESDVQRTHAQELLLDGRQPFEPGIDEDVGDDLLQLRLGGDRAEQGLQDQHALVGERAARVETEDRRLATNLADTRILFDGVPAPLVYVSDKQSSAIVPYGVAGRASVDVQVEYKGVRSEVMTVPVLASRPGIFSRDESGLGQGAIENEDGSLNSPANPARRGSIVTFYATGGGEAATGLADGQILSDVLPGTSLPV